MPNSSSEAISREGEFPQGIYFLAQVVGYFAYAQYDVIFLVVIAREHSDEAISRKGEFPQGIYLLAQVVGYFACAQYDVLFLHVILNEVKNPTEKVWRYILYLFGRWDISLALNMT